MTEDPITGSAGSRSMPPANRLIYEKSPYLLQHARNPVDWHPWGEEAFAAARREDRPVFLSIGYSTCHWCHVMARESFEDEVVAKLLNQTFICIKVDREERPDIDRVYMSAATAMTGRGGWPLTIIMTPDKKPFFAATYIPKSGRFGQAGMMEIIPRIKELWDNHRDEIALSADGILDHIRQMQKYPPDVKGHKPDASGLKGLLKSGYDALASLYDPQNGGFGRAPKFPAPHNLLFLLRYWKRSGEKLALQMVEETLQAMRRGGIYDHIGFGFHRYSTDAEWLVPHFEKMLYDQALISMAYTEAYQATGKEEYAAAARETLDYVCRDMTGPEGGFYSAEDADSEGMEGRFYTWTAEELKAALEAGEMSLVLRLFDVHENGNFEAGRNILRRTGSLADAAAVMKIDERDLSRRLEGIRARLFSAREKRVRPQKDDKILTDWNGLMIAALAKAARAFDEPRYAHAAKKAADFILREMQTGCMEGTSTPSQKSGSTGQKRLMHRYRGEAAISAHLDDYAFFIWGLIDLYETVFDARYLKEALMMCAVMMDCFLDSSSGLLFISADDANDLPVRSIDIYDGAIPSGNSIALLTLLRLFHLSGDAQWEEKAWDLARALLRAAQGQAAGHSMMLCSLDLAAGPAIEVALLEGRKEDESREGGGADMIQMLQAIRSRFLPSCSVLLVKGEMIKEIAPFTREMKPLEGRATAYICSGGSCSLPAASTDDLLDLLDRL
ncbi:MAG TPA: thioredoxin domain-containing protein [Methanothrix sp.]|nr:thioredoxin domain-containing protein [Methanothrix sp.]